jgi:ribA/ribD-fused uncharacterized protein
LSAKLLRQGEKEIVEASPLDRIWGVGFGAKNAERRRKDWGLNLLGKALERARERLSSRSRLLVQGVQPTFSWFLI